jgi:hypothetical protein
MLSELETRHYLTNLLTTRQGLLDAFILSSLVSVVDLLLYPGFGSAAVMTNTKVRFCSGLTSLGRVCGTCRLTIASSPQASRPRWRWRGFFKLEETSTPR